MVSLYASSHARTNCELGVVSRHWVHSKFVDVSMYVYVQLRHNHANICCSSSNLSLCTLHSAHRCAATAQSSMTITSSEPPVPAAVLPLPPAPPPFVLVLLVGLASFDFLLPLLDPGPSAGSTSSPSESSISIARVGPFPLVSVRRLE